MSQLLDRASDRPHARKHAYDAAAARNISPVALIKDLVKKPVWQKIIALQGNLFATYHIVRGCTDLHR